MIIFGNSILGFLLMQTSKKSPAGNDNGREQKPGVLGLGSPN